MRPRERKTFDYGDEVKCDQWNWNETGAIEQISGERCKRQTGGE